MLKRKLTSHEYSQLTDRQIFHNHPDWLNFNQYYRDSMHPNFIYIARFAMNKKGCYWECYEWERIVK